MVVLSEQPSSNFRQVNIYPTQEELLGRKTSFRKNIIDGRFENIDEYLDIQFRLLRADFIANVREALDSYRSNEPTKSIEIYKDVRILKQPNKYNDECLKLEIPTENDDKKFMMGSLLIFTRDNFNSMFLAKVLQKYPDRSEVTIDLIDTNDVYSNQRYTMAECSQYFDPYFQVLTALQNISPINFPMEKYIVNVDTTSIYMPKYLLYSNSNYEIDGYRIPPEKLPLINKNLLGLNSAQLEAFKAALTQEFVVIQGPPGTGKTHLGVKIATTLIKNAHFWYKNTPLLIVSHKNDALDQFLEGLIPITDRLIRVGGQSKSEKLKEFNLTNEKTDSGFLKKRPKEEYFKAMRNAFVVGMTTTLAARWKDFLERLKSPIVIIEEAAEVLEAHAVAALTNSCQHLILMGDHQQLQPLSADHNINKNYHLGVSLFERMVRNKVQHYQLKIQHRMKPEISSLLKSNVYPFLEDHKSVRARPDILGVEKNLFFVDHKNEEESCNYTTKKNPFEAGFLTSFARYLILNGYSPEEIVILATYAGQLQEFEKVTCKDKLLQNVKVSTLDGFQGQESEIVLLSLVRSESIGFLAKENRVCVALSRAKNGFFLMGNMNLLARSSKLWSSIRKCLERQKSIGRKLALKCQKHKTVTEVESLDDFWKVQNGGCSKKCEVLLSCGHICVLLCHNKYMKHKCEKGCVGSEASGDSFVSYANSRRSGNLQSWNLEQRNFVDLLFEGMGNVGLRVWGFILGCLQKLWRRFYD